MSKTHWMTSAVLVLAIIAAPLSASAQALVLNHTQSIYGDEKGVALATPEGIACRSDTAVIADTGNKRLVKFSVKNGTLLGGTEIKAEALVSPARVQLDSKGNILVLDRKGSRIVRLDSAGHSAAVVAVKVPGEPVAVVAFKVDGNDVVWVLDGAGRRVISLDAAGAMTRQIAVPKEALLTDFTVEGGRLFGIDAVAGVLWGADPGAATFQPISKSLKESMNFPAYLAGNRGGLVVVDQYGHGLVSVGTDGVYRGRQLTMGWSNGSVYYPAQLCIGAEGEVVIADRGNNRVQVFSLVQ